MAKLFQKDVRTVNEHLVNIIEGENLPARQLSEKSG
jgi:hypothetical protein